MDTRGEAKRKRLDRDRLERLLERLGVGGAPVGEGDRHPADHGVLDGVERRLGRAQPRLDADEGAIPWQIAAQSAQIGIAEADFYPAISLFGSIGWTGNSQSGSPRPALARRALWRCPFQAESGQEHPEPSPGSRLLMLQDGCHSTAPSIPCRFRLLAL